MKYNISSWTYSPATSPLRYSGISDRSKRPSGKKILLSGPVNPLHVVIKIKLT
ncbi:hypothetical protein HanXRQr2_Chr11g0472321 [Helianthus annuus]|uniref:Uncharacterized protein n=1 Tax=Helianthus annuus TaxID=4232 RepID=A0A9K3HLE4_HELAN|nr:hypothetical protein HanXRQr2_Chr11g0472321 [Helianthus annuus]KAJ0873706.1 hypothetical protein HanPSC8_Chr11g0455571 [Helianthus annuus]